MSYFPTDIPYMSEEELKENGIKVNCSDKPNNSCKWCGYVGMVDSQGNLF